MTTTALGYLLATCCLVPLVWWLQLVTTSVDGHGRPLAMEIEAAPSADGAKAARVRPSRLRLTLVSSQSRLKRRVRHSRLRDIA